MIESIWLWIVEVVTRSGWRVIGLTALYIAATTAGAVLMYDTAGDMGYPPAVRLLIPAFFEIALLVWWHVARRDENTKEQVGIAYALTVYYLLASAAMLVLNLARVDVTLRGAIIEREYIIIGLIAVSVFLVIVGYILIEQIVHHRTFGESESVI